MQHYIFETKHGLVWFKFKLQKINKQNIFHSNYKQNTKQK